MSLQEIVGFRRFLFNFFIANKNKKSLSFEVSVTAETRKQTLDIPYYYKKDMKDKTGIDVDCLQYR